MPHEGGASSNPRRRDSIRTAAITGSSAFADGDGLSVWKHRPSHRWHVFAVLHRQNNARAGVEARAISFGPVVDALARGDFAFAQEGRADRFAEFHRTGFCR